MKIGSHVKVKYTTHVDPVDFYSLNYYEKGEKLARCFTRSVHPSPSVTWVIIYLTASLSERDICEVISSAHQKDCFIHWYLIKSFPMSWLVFSWYSVRVVLGRGDFNCRLMIGNALHCTISASIFPQQIPVTLVQRIQPYVCFTIDHKWFKKSSILKYSD